MRLKTAALLLLCRALFGMPVEVSHPVTNFLRRLEEKGLVTPGFLSTLPRDASEIAEVLVQARQKDSLLNSWDRSRLNHFLNEFDPVRKR
ncbi:MAG TPA: hypothetical protein DCQ83_04825, partial [Fibrobacteres bacterium]|nr:hypothetical protein [Fibrobacterota bacterium]